MAGEQIIQSGLIVGRVAGPTITIVPTTDGVSTLAFDDRSGGQTSEITFNHTSNAYSITVGAVTQMLITSTDVTVDGDLIVNGTTITVNDANLNITDKVILVNKDEVLAGVGNGTGSAGIEVERGSLVNTDWLFSEPDDWWGTSGAIQTIGNIATIDSTLATEQVLTIIANGALKLPNGTTAQRPTPSSDMFRYNSSLSIIEAYDGSAWNEIVLQNTSSLNITSTTSGSQLVVESTDATSTNGPELILNRNSASPAALDQIGRIRFPGRNSIGGSIFGYVRIRAQIRDHTSTIESGILAIDVYRNGALKTVAVLESGISVGSPTNGDRGRGSINVKRLYVDGTRMDAINSSGGSLYGNLNVGDGSEVELSFTGITAAGSGYVVDDLLTISGGTSTTTAQLRVTSVDVSGAVLTFILERKGVYTVAPGSPASHTGGAGTLATFSLTSAASNVNILPDVDYSGAVIPKDIGQTDGVDGKSGNLRFRAMHAETFHGVATQAQYADLAERYAADATYKPGTVVIFGGEAEITLTTTKEDTRVAGVVSTDPAFKMNSMIGPDDTHPYIALKGKVPCKVIGVVRKGELLVTSSKTGYAESVENNAKPYTAFARANENFSGGEGVIQVSII